MSMPTSYDLDGDVRMDPVPALVKDFSIDPLEVILNPALLKSKLSNLPPKTATIHGARLLQDLLSIARFGTPTLVPEESASGNSGNSDEPVNQMQMMQLSERQDMLLRQACKVYCLASLTLDDIFSKVPQQNQLCLITTMLLAQQKPNSELAQMISQQVPWDPLTLFQRWILRARIAEEETSGLDLGDTKIHVTALQGKLDAVQQPPTDEKEQVVYCQILSDLGQYFCQSEQYLKAIEYLERCRDFHKHGSCHLDPNRNTVLLKLARLSLGRSLLDTKENTIVRSLELLNSKQHQELFEEFVQDNKARILPYLWRESAVRAVITRSDMRSAALLAVANALYQVGESSFMLLKLPSPVLKYLRAIPFSAGEESDAYLSRGIFDEIMELITHTLPGASSSLSRRDEELGLNIIQFVSKFCSAVRHTLCYNAAWDAGLLEPTEKDWNLVWNTYSYMLSSNITADSQETLPPVQEVDGLSRLLEKMDPLDLDVYLRSKSKPALTCALITLAFGAQAIQQGQFPKASVFFQTTAHFMTQVLEQSPVPAEGPSVALKRIDFQLRKYLAMSQIAMLARDIEQRREKRIMDRVEAHAKGMSASSTISASNATAGDVSTVFGESTAAPKEEEQDEDEAMIMELCKLLNQYLSTFGPMDNNLQLRCIAICIHARKWDFISTYCRTSVEILDRSQHPELCQVYGVLVPLCVILDLGHGQGLDLKDIASASALDALLSSGMDPMHITRMAALDMIQGLLINIPKPNPLTNRSGPNRWGNNASTPQQQQQDGSDVAHGNSGMVEDLGHAMILKLFGMVRLRGVLDVFGALVAGAITSILPERQKLTLSEFGYYALFTTSMDSLSSWTNPQIKAIALLSNGDAGRAIEAVPGARLRLTKLLIQVYERQVKFETKAVSRRIKVEARIHTQQQAAKSSTPSSPTSIPSSPQPTEQTFFSSSVLSSISEAQITRHCLCLADLYQVDGMHQESLAAFLHACMIASKGFTDVTRLDKRIWSAFVHSISGSLSPLPPPLPGLIGGAGGNNAGNASGDSAQAAFPTLTSLSNMQGPGSVGLGLTPPQPMTMDMNASGTSAGATPSGPGNSPMVPQTAVSGGTPNGTAAAGPAVPSVFATRAIESCMLLHEPLAAATMHQFLPRMDYTQAFAAIRLAHERGLISFASLGSGGGGTVVVASASGTGAGAGAGGTGPGGAGTFIPSLPRIQSTGKLYSSEMQKMIFGLHAEDESQELLSTTLLTPTSQFRRGSLIDPTSALVVEKPSSSRPPAFSSSNFYTGATTNPTPLQFLGRSTSSLSPSIPMPPALNANQFLELVYDLSELELVSYLCKQSKDAEGMLRVQARIGSHRMALDFRQPFRDQVRTLAQQDFLILMWSKYARVV